MNNGAFAEICGQLGADLEIKEAKSGKKYGILTVAVNKTIKQTESREPISKSHWFRIHVWNQSILENADLLKKGEKVLVIGELKTIKKQIIAEDGITVLGQYPAIIINIRNKSDITILKRDFPVIEGDKNSVSGENSDVEEKVA